MITEPLIATGLILLSVGSWRFMPHRLAWLGLIFTVLPFACLTAVVIYSDGSPLHPSFDQFSPGIELWHRLIAAAWWILGARAVLAVGNAIVLTRRGSRETKLVSDLVSGGAYLAATLAVVNTAFNVPIGGLVATSGVIAIVLGLALQNTLADVFSGIAIGIEGPISVGDRIWIEGPVEGEVVEINWRSIRIRTDGNDIAIVPHSIVAKSRIINRSYPTARRGDAIAISCDPVVASHRVIDLVKRAILLCPLVLKDPVPSVALIQLGAKRNTYEVYFSVATSSLLGSARSTLLIEIFRQFRYEGIHVERARLEAPRSAEKNETSLSTGAYPPSQLVSELSLFHGLSVSHQNKLVESLVRHVFEAQDIVFSQGATDASLFIIASGVLEVTREGAERRLVIGRIGPGDYIGEIGMLTGAPHAATVTALTTCIVYELRKVDIASVLEAEPELVSAFEASARRGQELIARAAAAGASSHAGPPGQLLSRIRSFFGLPHS
jgi:small-conductance mechanosensitive channel/CRP-like cAMP-binding protein